MANQSDGFHRSRLTALTTSGLMLAISIADASRIKTAQLFGVAVGSISTRFLILCLVVASTVSLFALWLSYWNEARDLQAVKFRALENTAIPESVAGDVQGISRSMESLHSGVSKLENLPRIRNEVAEVAVSSSQIENAVLSLWTFQDSEDLKRVILEDAACVVDQFYNPGAAAISHVFSVINTRQSERFLKLDQPLIIRGADINEIMAGLAVVKMEVAVFKQKLATLNSDISAYNRFVKSARLSLKLDVFVIGMLVPSAFYVVALAHAVGALGLKFLPSAPQVVDRLLGQ